MSENHGYEETIQKILEDIYLGKRRREADFSEKVEEKLYKYFLVYGNLKDGERIRKVRIEEKRSRKKIIVEYANNKYEFYNKEFPYDEIMEDAIRIKTTTYHLEEDICSILNLVTSEQNLEKIGFVLPSGMIKEILEKVENINMDSFLSQEQIEEFVFMKALLIAIAEKCGIQVDRKDYEYKEPLLSELKEKENLSPDDCEYLRIAEEYLNTKELNITDKKFNKLSIDKKVKITCQKILYDSIKTIQYRVVRKSMDGPRVRKAQLEEEQVRKRHQVETIDKILSGEEMSTEAIRRFFLNMRDEWICSKEETENFGRPHLLESINRKIQAIEMLAPKYPDAMNYESILTRYRNKQQFISALFQYLNSNSWDQKEKWSTELFSYSRKRRDEQLELLTEYAKKYKGMNNQYSKLERNFDYFGTIDTLKAGIRVLETKTDWDAERRRKSMQEDLAFINLAHTSINISDNLQNFPTIESNLCGSQWSLDSYVSAKDMINREEDNKGLSQIIPILQEQIERFEEEVPNEIIATVQVDKVELPKQLLKKIGNVSK